MLGVFQTQGTLPLAQARHTGFALWFRLAGQGRDRQSILVDRDLIAGHQLRNQRRQLFLSLIDAEDLYEKKKFLQFMIVMAVGSGARIL